MAQALKDEIHTNNVKVVSSTSQTAHSGLITKIDRLSSRKEHVFWDVQLYRLKALCSFATSGKH